MAIVPLKSRKHSGKSTAFFEDFVIGGTAAGIAKTIAAPIERVKLLLQNQGEQGALKVKYSGITNCILRVGREQGVKAFWRGNLANVLRYFPTQALNFMFKEQYKKMFSQPQTAPFLQRLYGNVASGGAAGATSLLVVYPLDFARTRLAVDVGKGATREFKGTIDCILKTARTSGWLKGGVYNGFMVSCIGIMFYRGAYFGIYDTISEKGFFKNAGFWNKFLLSYSVTVAAGTISYPIDTVRRRMMMTSGKYAGKYKNSLDCFRQIISKEGFASLYKGNASNIIRSLCGAIVLVGFDFIKEYYVKIRYGEDAAKHIKKFKG